MKFKSKKDGDEIETQEVNGHTFYLVKKTPVKTPKE